MTVRCQWKKKTINFFVGPKRGVPQLSPLAQLQLPLSIGDEGIPQCGSESLSSAHLSAQLQLTHQLSSSYHFLLATTESPNMDENASAQSVSSASASTFYWRRWNPPVWIRIRQLSSPLSSAPAHPSAQLQLPLLIGDDESLIESHSPFWLKHLASAIPTVHGAFLLVSLDDLNKCRTRKLSFQLHVLVSASMVLFASVRKIQKQTAKIWIGRGVIALSAGLLLRMGLESV